MLLSLALHKLAPSDRDQTLCEGVLLLWQWPLQDYALTIGNANLYAETAERPAQLSQLWSRVTCRVFSFTEHSLLRQQYDKQHCILIRLLRKIEHMAVQELL